MESAFLYACGYGRKEVAEFLLEQGVDPCLRNDAGQTGLHWAAYGADVDLVRLLLQRDSPADVRDEGFHATSNSQGIGFFSKCQYTLCGTLADILSTISCKFLSISFAKGD